MRHVLWGGLPLTLRLGVVVDGGKAEAVAGLGRWAGALLLRHALCFGSRCICKVYRRECLAAQITSKKSLHGALNIPWEPHIGWRSKFYHSVTLWQAR